MLSVDVLVAGSVDTARRISIVAHPTSLCHGGVTFREGEEVLVGLIQIENEWMVWERPLKVNLSSGLDVRRLIDEIGDVRSGQRRLFSPGLQKAIYAQAGVIRMVADYPQYEANEYSVARIVGEVSTSNAVESSPASSSSPLSGPRQFAGGGSWNGSVPIRINPAGAKGPSGSFLTFTQIKPVVDRAAAEWNDVIHSQVIFSVSATPTSQS